MIDLKALKMSNSFRSLSPARVRCCGEVRLYGMTFLSSETDQCPPDPCMQLPNTTRLQDLIPLKPQWSRKRSSNETRQHVKRTLNSLQPTMLPIYQVLAYDSAFSKFYVYGFRAYREITVPLGTEIEIAERTTGGSTS